MPLISGKQAFLEVLKQEGIQYIFGNPGSTELPVMDALAGQEEIRYFLSLHEGVAVSMADGYSVASGKPAVVNVHVSPDEVGYDTWFEGRLMTSIRFTSQGR